MAKPNRVTSTRLLLGLFLFIFVASYASAFAPTKQKVKPAPPPPVEPAPEPTPPPAPPPVPVEDPLGRSTPYGCVSGFISAVNSKNLSKAIQFLDTKLPQPKAEELALQLKAVLDAGLSSGINGLSHDALGDLRDDLPITRERVGVIKTPNGNVDILLDRKSRPEEPNIWLFSSETLEMIPNLHLNLEKKQDYSRFFPAPIFQKEILGLPLWRWIGISMAMLLIIAFSSLVTRLLFWIVKLIFHLRHLQDESTFLDKLKQPVRLLLLALALILVKTYSLSVLSRSYWTAASRTAGIIGLAWLLARLADIVGSVAERRSLESGARQKIALITLGRRLFKIIAFLTVFLLFLKGAGINVSAMLAGLGIGGVALALAAQKTLEDLFGGISIILRDSIRVGDFCSVADQTGIIQDIGLSSTRIRTLNRTIVSIPNSKIAQLNSENYALRDKFWFHHILGLSADTTNTQLEEIATAIQKLLDQSDEVELGTNRINFIGFSNASPQFEIVAYLLTSTFDLFLAEQQKLLFKVLAIISDAGARLASPTHIAYTQLDNPETNPSPLPLPKESLEQRSSHSTVR